MKFSAFSNFALPKLHKAIEEFNRSLVANNTRVEMQGELIHFTKLNKGGKCLRGLLAMFGYFAGKGYSEQDFNNANLLDEAVNMALAIEVFQTGILMQDDVIDQDSLRRGVQTLHSKIAEDNGNVPSAIHYSNSIATLMGYIGILKANEIIIDTYKNSANFAQIQQLFNSMQINTYTGEFLDVKRSGENDNRQKLTKETFKGKVMGFIEEDFSSYDLTTSILQMYKLKTVDYTILKPIMLGLALSGCEYNSTELAKFATYLGVAFQIQDDYLGIYGHMEKDGCSDINEGKKTLLFAFVKEKGVYLDKLLKYYGKKVVNRGTLEVVKRIFEDSGAKAVVEDIQFALFAKAEEVVNNLSFANEDGKQLLCDFVEYLKNREK